MEFSSEFDTILLYAREEAVRTGHNVVGSDHIMLGILRHRDNRACRILSELSVSSDDLKSALDAALMKEKAIPFGKAQEVYQGADAERIIGAALMAASQVSELTIDSAHLLIALSEDTSSLAGQLLSKEVVNRQSITRCEAFQGKTPDNRHPQVQKRYTTIFIRKTEIFS